MNRILITGGNGFLGSNLVRFFLRKSYAVCVISRKCNNLVDVLDSIEFIEHASPGYTQFADQIGVFNPTVVIHCAWDGGNNYKDVSSFGQFYNNIPQSIELLEVISSHTNKPHFVGIGAFSEYGKFESLVDEKTVGVPTSYYGVSKTAFNLISKMICDQKDMNWSWIRPCYIYGDGDVETRLIPSLIRKCTGGEDITLDSCNVVIDYLHVGDFCTGVCAIVDKSASGVFNICSAEERQLRSIIEFIRNSIQSSSRITFDSTLNRDRLSTYTCGNNSRLRSLGWKPVTPLEEGLTQMIQSATRSGLNHLTTCNMLYQ